MESLDVPEEKAQRGIQKDIQKLMVEGMRKQRSLTVGPLPDPKDPKRPGLLERPQTWPMRDSP